MATNIFNINPERFTLEDYSSSDLTLIPQFYYYNLYKQQQRVQFKFLHFLCQIPLSH